MSLLIKETVIIKDVVQFVDTGAAGNHIPDATFRHIQAECTFLTQRVLLHLDKLNATNTRIAACILCKALGLSKIVNTGRIVRLKNVYNVFATISSDDEEVRVSRLLLTVDFIRDT